MTSKLMSMIAIALLAALTLSACGRKGDPIPPSVARAEAAQEAGQPVPETPATEDRRFILDPLLD